MNEDRLRLSDSERDAAAADLGEHYAQGRLSAEEHDERLGAVWAAKTRGELPGLFADLPSPFARAVAPQPLQPPQSPQSPQPAFLLPQRRGALARGFRGLPPALRVAVAVLLAMVVIAHLPLVLVAGLIWFVVTRHHARGRVHPAWQPHQHWR